MKDDFSMSLKFEIVNSPSLGELFFNIFKFYSLLPWPPFLAISGFLVFYPFYLPQFVSSMFSQLLGSRNKTSRRQKWWSSSFWKNNSRLHSEKLIVFIINRPYGRLHIKMFKVLFYLNKMVVFISKCLRYCFTEIKWSSSYQNV